jgi:membrane protease YdiL (CAAX protease family)
VNRAIQNKNLTQKIAIIFAASAVIMFFVNELQRHVTLSSNQFYGIASIVKILCVAVVLKVQPWRPKIESPARILSSLFFTFGAFAIALLFSRYWMEWAGSFDPEGTILGPVRDLEPISVSSQNSIIDTMRRVIITPVAEEIAFRLGILGVLSRVMPRGWALLISSLCFAFGHIYGYTWVQLVPLFVVGLLLGVTYLAAGLGFSILFHSVINLWPYVTENFYKSQTFLGTLFVLLLIGLVVFLVQIVRLRKVVFRS